MSRVIFNRIGMALGALAVSLVSHEASAQVTEEGNYPLCVGQGGDVDPAALDRAGEMSTQLAPAFLDEMARCEAADLAPSDALLDAGAGSVNEKGDCAWSNGVSCHYHLGVEFIDSTAGRPAHGEIHCIFPSDDPASPEVFGGHFVCAGGAHAEPGAHGEHVVNHGAACGEGLLTELAAALQACSGVQCCDDGTLTTTTEARTEAGTLAVRPDFHICASTMELNCAALTSMTGHSANAPAFGAPIEDGFAVPAAHE